ncbi:MAG: hypothetical protein LBE80_08095 [Deltaproteobacteria bacterium]|nr:hypothetical protein [Deltaproteobacteria bacterium]
MTRLDSLFQELGQRLGLGPVGFSEESPLALDLEGLGGLVFEMAPQLGDLLVSLAWPLAAYDKSTLIRALEACSLEKSLDFPLQAGLYQDHLLLMVRRNPARLSAPELEELVLNLIKIRDKILET